MALSIFYCDCLDLGTGPEAARLDVSYMRDKFFNVGIKAAVLFTKGLHCMHWHARVARSVVLALTFLIMTTRTQTTRYVCVCCEQRGTFTSAFPTIRAARTHIGRSRTCAAAGLGIQEITLETRQTDTMVGGSGAAGPAPDLRHQPPGSTHFCKQNVGVGYTRYIYRISILFRVYPVDMT